jgi:hypothetical protein
MRSICMGVVAAVCGCHLDVSGEVTFGPDAPVAEPDGAPNGTQSGVAPDDFHPGEVPLADGDNTVDVAAGGTAIFRIESAPSEHVAFKLTFPAASGVVMAAERWNGTAAVNLGETDAGAGLRVLAVRDASQDRTYWVIVKAGPQALHGTLAVTRTPFEDGNTCAADCTRLLQLPLPNDPVVDGYATDSATVFRYWFGRRDMLMFLRTAGRKQALAGYAPFIPQDLSQWDGQTPGTDVGAPRHASHQRGKDVDISLYGTDGLAPWRSYCTITTASGGRQCVAGTVMGFDSYTTAIEVASFFETGRVTMSFLDQQLIAKIIPGSMQAATDGKISPTLVPLYSDGVHIQNWPNHDNHIHIRVSETPYGTTQLAATPFEAP